MAAVKDLDRAPAIDWSEYENDDVEESDSVVPEGWEHQEVIRPALHEIARYALGFDPVTPMAGYSPRLHDLTLAQTAAPNVKFPRSLHRGAVGWDVIGHKRAWSRAFPDLYPWPTSGNHFTDFFGPSFEAAVKKGQARMHIMASGKIGSATHEALERTRRHGHPTEWAFDDRAIQLCHDYAVTYAKTPEEIIREAMVAAWNYWVSVNSHIAYSQDRPFGLYRPPAYEREMDCSEFYTLGCFAGGAPDPNHFGYTGIGYTGSIMAHTARCMITDLEPGDPVFYGFASPRPGFPAGSPTHIAGYGGIQYSPERGRSVRVIYTMASSADPRVRPLDYRHDVNHYAKLPMAA